MELWTFIHKDTNEYIRFNKIDIDDDLGTLYYFSNVETLPIWVSSNLDDMVYLLNAISVPPIYSMLHTKPSNEYVNLKNYEIFKINL